MILLKGLITSALDLASVKEVEELLLRIGRGVRGIILASTKNRGNCH